MNFHCFQAQSVVNMRYVALNILIMLNFSASYSLGSQLLFLCLRFIALRSVLYLSYSVLAHFVHHCTFLISGFVPLLFFSLSGICYIWIHVLLPQCKEIVWICFVFKIYKFFLYISHLKCSISDYLSCISPRVY